MRCLGNYIVVASATLSAICCKTQRAVERCCIQSALGQQILRKSPYLGEHAI